MDLNTLAGMERDIKQTNPRLQWYQVRGIADGYLGRPAMPPFGYEHEYMAAYTIAQSKRR